MSKYSLEFKLKIIQEMEETGYRAVLIGMKYGINQSIIALWYRKYQSSGVEGLTVKHFQDLE